MRPDDAPARAGDQGSARDMTGLRRRVEHFLRTTTIRREIRIVALIALTVCIVHGLRLGQDTNWDQRNYHYYAVHALLEGRLTQDVGPAQSQTWLNPAGSLLAYALMAHASPRVATAVLSALSAVPLVMVFALSVFSLAAPARRQWGLRLAVGVMACVGAFTAPMFLSEIGTTFNDTISSALVLAALAVLLADGFSRRAYVWAGVFLGIAVGLKLTNGFYAVGWAAAVIAVERRRFLRPLVLGAGTALLAYVPVGGLWNVYLWQQFGNPLFPIYNHIFRSPFYRLDAMQDERFRPKGFVEALGYFWQWPAGGHPTSELFFVDIRFTLVPLLLALALVAWGLRRRFPAAGPAAAAPALFDPRARRLLVTFFLASFALWLFVFAIQRYAMALEMLAPLVLMLLLSLALRRRALVLALSAVLMVAIARTTVSPGWGRVPFTADWFEVKLPDELKRGDALFVMLSDEPTAYVIPALPASDVFVRIEGNMPIPPDTGLGQVIAGKLAAHRGDLWTLAPAGYALAGSAAALAAYGLRAAPQDCLVIATKMGDLESCRLARAGG